ncbi:MAG: S-layer homology domain-containing protein [Clostridia bacterium]|nr:S-layer homology domain-containing protein [Clostridia bacterium]
MKRLLCLLLAVVFACSNMLGMTVFALASCEDIGETHNMEAVSFEWNEFTYASCVVNVRCIVCDVTEVHECTITRSETAGEILYTATLHLNGQTFSTTHSEPLPPPPDPGHSYGSPVFTWNDDNTASASVVCSHCAEDAAERTLTAACTVTQNTTPASCGSVGETVYIAEAVLDGVTYSDTRTVAIPMLDHVFTAPEFIWDEDTCEVFYSCTVGGEQYRDACTVAKKTEYTSCTEPGTLTLTASVTIGGNTYADKTEHVLEPRGHSEARLAGNPATCTEPGLTDGIVCSVCGEILKAQTEIAASGHNWGAAVLEIGEDGTTVSAYRGCENECGARMDGTVTVTYPDDPGTDPTTAVTASAVFPDGFTVETTLMLPNPEAGDEPDTPTAPETPDVPDTPTAPETPDVPDTPTAPETPDVPDTPTAPETPDVPDTPTAPEIPAVPAEPTPSEPETPTFDDVSTDSYYYDAVIWADVNGITHGTGDGMFSPDGICTRAQVVTMLWRAAGAPKAEHAHPFTDVPADAYYADAVVWASRMGITAGTSDTTFSPELLCTRAQIVTLLWRAAGCPAVSAADAFADVTADAYYADAVAWAVAGGITHGTGDGVFSPDMACTRAQIVTFMYRAALPSVG